MTKSRIIRSYDYINHPFENVCDALSGDVPSIFSNATKTAAERANNVATELRVNISGIEVGTDIAIKSSKAEDASDQDGKSQLMRLKLEWEAAKSPRLFPLMKAELSVYPLTATETQLDFLGSYEVPGGVLGNAIDAVMGHRIAEASVHRFIKSVAAYLRDTLAE